VNQSRFFQSGNDSIVHPVVERTHSRNVREFRASRSAASLPLAPNPCAFLDGAIEAPQHAHRLRHRFRRKQSAAKHTFAQASNFTVFVDFFQPPAFRREIFRRTEFDPMSMAANVGIGVTKQRR